MSDQTQTEPLAPDVTEQATELDQAVEAYENEGGGASHDSLFREKVKSLAKIVDEKIAAKDAAHASWTIAKAELDAAYEDLHKAAKDVEQFLPFGHPDPDVPTVEDVAASTPVHEQDDSWRAVALADALPDLPKGVFKSFAENDPPLECMGDLADWTKEKALTDIPGIGPGKGQKIEDACMAFWERRRSGPSPAPELPAHNPDAPWKAEGEPAPAGDFGTAEATVTATVNHDALNAALV